MLQVSRNAGNASRSSSTGSKLRIHSGFSLGVRMKRSGDLLEKARLRDRVKMLRLGRLDLPG